MKSGRKSVSTSDLKLMFLQDFLLIFSSITGGVTGEGPDDVILGRGTSDDDVTCQIIGLYRH